MSYVYDPTTGFAQWMAEMSFATRTNDPPHGVYGSMYGPREEYEVLRQQNAYQDQHRVQHSPAGISGDPDWSYGPASRSKLPNRSRVPVRKSTAKPDVVSKKKKGKAPVTRDQETGSSDHSSDASSSNTVHYELEVSSSQDSTPLGKGKVTPAETTSCGDSCHCLKKTEHRTDGTTSRRRSSVSDQNSGY